MLYICILTMHIRCFQNERSAPPLFYVAICGKSVNILLIALVVCYTHVVVLTQLE